MCIRDRPVSAWTFTTPSSTDGRKIVKAASAIANRSLKGSSNWRKEDWEAAAKRADVRFLDTFSTLPGMRGFRACWAPNGVALLYVPGVRKFFSVNDVKDGVADARADAAAGGVDAALVNLCRVKKGFEEQYLVACDADAAMEAAPRAARDAAERAAGVRRSAGAEVGADGQPVETTEAKGLADSSNGSASLVDEARASYDTPLGAIARWCMGLGVDAAALHAEFGLGFDFHGPAGAVSRAVVAAAAARAGDAAATSDEATASWAKAEWVEAMARYGVTTRSTHAPLGALGRSWKVCWVADALELGAPAVFLWVPERNAYYTLGSLAAATSAPNAAREGGAPTAVEAAIRAVVGVAKSTPAPPGLKAALTRDCDFLTLLGRKPKEANAPVSAGTTGGADAARAADARFVEDRFPNVDGGPSPATGPPVPLDASGQETLEASLPANAREETHEEAFETNDVIGNRESTSPRDDDSSLDASAKIDLDDAEMPSDEMTSFEMTSDEMTSSSYFRPAPELDDFEWADSRDGLRRRPSREDDGAFEPSRDLVNPTAFVDEPMSAPGFEDVPGMEGFLPVSYTHLTLPTILRV